MRLRKIHLPSRSRTLTDKIRKDNPWNQGTTLAQVFDTIWDSIRDASGMRKGEFCHRLATEHQLLEWCNEHHIAPFHVAWEIADAYLV